ncbi:GMC family oxidoreductase N-terminal domain-containing protein [Streptomyces sp. NPDC052101]|uniref:GMC family oxidoreductase N-terminal domain-containing protein n=1 Tax=Streptomyces sp. NPDC052101 TaxID=3155763 RepID=UPI003430D3A6
MAWYDYIIVGGGSAGCVLAARLSEDPSVNVVLIEAGRPDDAKEIHVPAAYARLFQSAYDWNLWSEPEPGLGGRRLPLTRGLVLGGCSSQNGMIYIRGNHHDYDSYAAHGAEGWSYEDVLPYFRRSEDNERGKDAYHGTGGPLAVSDGRSRHPLADAFLDACTQAGHPRNPDFNGPCQDGVGRYQLTQRDGRRCSTSAFLRPARARPNLTVLTGALVLHVIIERGRATGVRIKRGGEELTVTAAQEVVLCAGTYNSPQLLLLSGIGPATELAAHGINTHQDLPVGHGLQDHLAVPLVWRTHEKTLHSQSTPHALQTALNEGRGPMTSNGSESGGFFRSTADQPAPDIQLYLSHAMFHQEGLGEVDTDAYTILASSISPASRGRVTLRSAAPDHKPRIVNNYLSTTEEKTTAVESVRLALDIAGRLALRSRGGRPYLVPESGTDSAIEDFIRRTGCSTYHPTSTCAIGSVVDPQLRVLGIDGLRVADASVLPSVPRGNTNAAAIMIAEKAADLITGHGLPSAAASPQTHPAALSAQPRPQLTGLADTQARVEPAELDAVWEALASVRPEQILGTWRGTPLNTGHSAQRRLRDMRWYGKRFNSPDDVQPLICRDQQGRLYSNTEASGEEGRLRMLPFRNDITAALLYDGRPVVDYFKAADPDTLMGIMTGGDEPSDKGQAFYFILRRS